MTDEIDIVGKLYQIAEEFTPETDRRRAIEKAAETITRLRSLTSCPEGWKLAPIEPDEKMKTAGMRAWCEDVAHSYQGRAGLVYRAMISASPSPPIPAVEIDGEKR